MSVVPASLRTRVRSTIETPVARVFGRLGLTPNMLTLIGFGIAIVGAYFAAVQSWLLAGLIVAFGAIFDLFDGALARATNKTSNFGAFLDSTMDRAGEGVVYIGIVVGLATLMYDNPIGVYLAVAAMAASYMVSYVRSRAESLGFSPGSGMASVGLAPREVRMSILVVGMLAIPWTIAQDFLLMHAPVPQSLLVALGLITVLATITAIQRILFTYNQSRSQNQEVNH